MLLLGRESIDIPPARISWGYLMKGDDVSSEYNLGSNHGASQAMRQNVGNCFHPTLCRDVFQKRHHKVTR